jgi:hypothetical protein
MHIRRGITHRNWHWNGPGWWWKRGREWTHGSDITGESLDHREISIQQNGTFRLMIIDDCQSPIKHRTITLKVTTADRHDPGKLSKLINFATRVVNMNGEFPFIVLLLFSRDWHRVLYFM